MEINTINATLFAKMFLAGAKNLESKKEWINELNVFPVPDGDTGTNMTMTIMAAAKEVAALEDPTMEVLAKAISSGSLRGARGNSGVILSQLKQILKTRMRLKKRSDLFNIQMVNIIHINNSVGISHGNSGYVIDFSVYIQRFIDNFLLL